MNDVLDGKASSAQQLIDLADGDWDAERLCREAEDRNALQTNGAVRASRLAGLADCLGLGQGCAPKDLTYLLKKDERAQSLSPLARLMLFEGVVPSANWDGVVEPPTLLEGSSGYHPKTELFDLLAHAAGITRRQAERAAAELERQHLVIFGAMKNS